MSQLKSRSTATMLTARLHGPADMRIERVPRPDTPRRGEVLLRVKATGICGSDLHSYQDARIGVTEISSPLVLGHEFAGIIEDTGSSAFDGNGQILQTGTLVAVDPAQPCHRCEMCEQGHPNLCLDLRFCSNHPHDGSLQQWMRVPARCCFPVPAGMDAETAALLEPLGVAIHAIDLAKIRVADTVAILGAGGIGLMLLQVARLAGADPVFVTDKLPWRLALARKLGGQPIRCDRSNPVQRVLTATGGRGVDVAIEAAWGDESIEQAAEMTRLGGRVVLVGIPSDDQLAMKHSTARRKGLTIKLCRRMKHTYPRAIRLAASRKVELKSLVTHRFPLKRVAEAFELNSRYADKVVKIIIQS